MAADDVTRCPFDFSEGLEFDPSLAELMARGSPTRIALPYGDADAWLVTGFEQVRRVTVDPRFSRAAIVGADFPRMTPRPIVSPESINVVDPPRSSRLRRLAAQAFTQHHADRMRARITRLADGLLEEMAAQGPPADLVRHLADRLPEQTVFDLLGIPRADWPLTQHRLHLLLGTGAGGGERAASAKSALRAYFLDLVRRRRQVPGDDLISALAAAEDGTDTLDDQELAVMALTLTLSGVDTATCQISNIAYVLLTRPELADELRGGRRSLPDVLHELLRVIPFRKGVGIPRVALEDVVLDGVRIRAGEYVHVSYLAANRDPARYPRPHDLDPDRPAVPHMTFGWGGHRCVAVPLALTELEVAIGGLLARFPGLRLAVPARELRWDTETIRRFPVALPVAW
ncbi:cytochrome P450 [Streptomyces griseoviridis]|uniref:Cytochrome P450 n=1 Tax=Streptomyces griseoviridis TaxID=45398 RepID=A0A3Q9L1X9_STRGD|nr:cytochrome P450 [Streptomyces griseoviridis]AZS89434.1 cytochrome P450 [Streptomyces griseoviridis]QCN83725.1 cytochrome P450 [Streptomyces griseoviridis]